MYAKACEDMPGTHNNFFSLREHTQVENLSKQSTPEKMFALFTRPKFEKSTILERKSEQKKADSAKTARKH